MPFSLSFYPLKILYNSKFIIMVMSLGTNAVVVTRVHCSLYFLVFCGHGLIQDFFKENMRFTDEASTGRNSLVWPRKLDTSGSFDMLCESASCFQVSILLELIYFLSYSWLFDGHKMSLHTLHQLILYFLGQVVQK